MILSLESKYAVGFKCCTLSPSRLERNKEREESISNMEYLKNVVLKVHLCERLSAYIDDSDDGCIVYYYICK